MMFSCFIPTADQLPDNIFLHQRLLYFYVSLYTVNHMEKIIDFGLHLLAFLKNIFDGEIIGRNRLSCNFY